LKLRPLYLLGDEPKLVRGSSHKGLWFDRFFDRYSQDWSVEPSAKRDWIRTVEGNCGNEEALTRATHSQLNLCEARSGAAFCARTDWHFATGLGLPHPVENGFQWHPTLGVPYLPGSAVKGLVRAYLEAWADPSADRAQLYAWFGSECKDPLESDAPFATGGFIFFDALPVKPPQLEPDVMTPHMGKWYELGNQIVNVTRDADKVPADWHEPIPVPFLVVKQASFLFCVAPRRKELTEQLPQVIQALRDALDWLGAGAKTAVGYGRMIDDDEALQQLRAAMRVANEARQVARQKREADQKLKVALATLPKDAGELEQLAHSSDWEDNGRFLNDVEAFLKGRDKLSLPAWQRLVKELETKWAGIMENPDAKVGKRGDKEKYKRRPRELARQLLAGKPPAPPLSGVAKR
jgi:CRISPR-associated protein Cmr6